MQQKVFQGEYKTSDKRQRRLRGGLRRSGRNGPLICTYNFQLYIMIKATCFELRWPSSRIVNIVDFMALICRCGFGLINSATRSEYAAAQMYESEERRGRLGSHNMLWMI